MKKGTSLGQKASRIGNSLGIWLVVIVLAAFMSIMNDKFLTMDNIINVARQISVNAIIAVGVSFVILGGGMDLSTGLASTFAGCNAALLMTKCGMNMWLAILICLAAGILVGAVSGVIVTVLKIPPFIGTLGVQYVLHGVIQLLTNNMPISGLPEPFMIIGRGYIFDIIPVSVVIMAVFVAVGAIVLRYTPFGRNVLSVGENAVAARLSGINVTKTKIMIYAICGFCAAAAGIVQTSRMSSGQPSTGGDLAFQAIAAVFVGGTFKGSMMNTLAGVLALGLINNGLNLIGINPFWQKIALGVIIVLSVWLDQYRIKVAMNTK